MNSVFLLVPNPKGLGPIDSGCPSVRPSVRPSVIDSFPGYIFVKYGRRDLGMESKKGFSF